VYDILDSSDKNERWLQKRRDAVPWPFRLKEKSQKPQEPQDAKIAALVELRRDLDRDLGDLRDMDKWELIPDAVDEDAAAELIALRHFYEDSAKELKELRGQWHDALLKRDDLAEFVQRGDELRDLERQRLDALVRIQELTAEAKERRKEPQFLRLAQDVLEAEVRLSYHDRLEVLLAQKAWDTGAAFVSPRITGDAKGVFAAQRSQVWSLALAQICDMGWHLHTWSANGKIATPLFHRPPK